MNNIFVGLAEVQVLHTSLAMGFIIIQLLFFALQLTNNYPTDLLKKRPEFELTRVGNDCHCDFVGFFKYGSEPIAPETSRWNCWIEAPERLQTKSLLPQKNLAEWISDKNTRWGSAAVRFPAPRGDLQFNPPRRGMNIANPGNNSPRGDDISNKYPLYTVYMGLMIKIYLIS